MTYVNKDDVDYKAENRPTGTEVTTFDFRHKLAYLILTLLVAINFAVAVIMIGRVRDLTNQNLTLQQQNRTLNAKAESLQQHLDELLKGHGNVPNR